METAEVITMLTDQKIPYQRFFQMKIHYKTLYPPFTVPEPIPMNRIYTFLSLYTGNKVERVELMEIEPAVLKEVTTKNENNILRPPNNGQTPDQKQNPPS